MIMTWKKTSYWFSVLLMALPLVACGGQKETAEEVDKPGSSATSQTSQNNTTQNQGQAAPGGFVAGQDYYLLDNPIDPEAQQGIEVLEVFWFGCPHCNATQPYVRRWEASKPAEATLVRMPAPLSGLWKLHAQIFYTNQAMGLEEKLQQPTFDALHRKKLRLTSVDQFADYYSENFGVNADDYRKTFSSFSVNLKLQRATERVTQAGIDGVPAFIVAGKYLVNGKSAGTTSRIFQIINYLVGIES